MNRCEAVLKKAEERHDRMTADYTAADIKKVGTEEFHRLYCRQWNAYRKVVWIWKLRKR